MSLLERSLARLGAAPERIVRATFGDPPRNDRGVELDLTTHAMLRLGEMIGANEIHHLPPGRARRQAAQSGALVDPRPTPGVERRDGELPGATGSLRYALWRPRLVGPRPSLLPLLVWLHGGGFVIGGLHSHASLCSFLAARARVAVLAVEYRKAPEHRFPAAVEDCLAAWRHIRDRPEQFGAAAGPVALGGDSAGGNLSAVICQALREAGEPQPALQVLVYPSTDLLDKAPSHHHFGEGLLLTREMLDWFRSHYVPSGVDPGDPRLSPLRASSFAGLAPALVRTAGFDPLRDEGEAYAAALREAGVEVDLRCHEPLIHNFVAMRRIPANRHAVRDLADDIGARLLSK